MGQAKKTFYDGLPDNISVDTLICSSHFEDDFLKDYIQKRGSIGKCSYCSSRRKVVCFDDFYEVLEIGINYLFEDATDSRYINHDGELGLDGDTFLAWDIVYDDKLELHIDDEEICKDILKKLDNDIIYCRRDEFGDETDFYTDEWNYFKDVVKHKARFVFYFKKTFKEYFHSNPIDILKNIQLEIINLKLFRTITPKTTIYRCTQHKYIDDVKPDGKRIASNPVENCKGQNRMSPAGISMFYGGEDKETCIKEAVDFSFKENPYYSIAKFTPKQNLKLINLMEFPELPSIFDSENNNRRESIMFLKAFTEDISKHINKSDTSIEYVPTQVITEYIKFNPKLSVDGIIYPSAKGNKSANYVLFMDNKVSLEKLDFHFNSVNTKHI
jgi:hypothetical protein